MDEDKITIYSYAKVWRYEKKIYNIMNWNLPSPINPYDLATFIGILMAELMAGNVLPFIGRMPFVLKYLVIPYLGTYILRRKKLDGKNPISYFFGALWYYLFTAGTYVEGWKRRRDKTKKIKLDWYYSVGKRKDV